MCDGRSEEVRGGREQGEQQASNTDNRDARCELKGGNLLLLSFHQLADLKFRLEVIKLFKSTLG